MFTASRCWEAQPWRCRSSSWTSGRTSGASAADSDVLQVDVGQLGVVSGSRQLLFQVPDASFRLIPHCRHRIERESSHRHSPMCQAQTSLSNDPFTVEIHAVASW